MPRYPKELKGNAFVGSFFEVTDPEDLAFGEGATPRDCTHCFFRNSQDVDCMLAHNTAKHDFGIPKKKSCPHR